MSDSESRQPGTKRDQAIIFNAREIGQSFREVAVDVLRKESGEIESRWLHSVKDADIFIWKDQNRNIIKQQMTFFGQLVEWNIMEGVRTGLIIEDDTSQKMGASPLIRYDTTPLQHGMEQAIDIVSYTTALSIDDKQKLIENFIKSPQFEDIGAFELIQKFGFELKADRIIRDGPGWFARFLKFLGLSAK